MKSRAIEKQLCNKLSLRGWVEKLKIGVNCSKEPLIKRGADTLVRARASICKRAGRKMVLVQSCSKSLIPEYFMRKSLFLKDPAPDGL
jgi:hypothetical protein